MSASNGPGDASGASIPALSVVMPAYNAEAFIDEAIESILGQTFTDLELVIVDDASTDRTWSIITEHAADDPRIRAFRNEANLGPAGSINRGIDLAAAPLIGRMDADDVSHPTRFEKQVNELRGNPHYAVVGTFASHTNEQGKIIGFSATGPRSEADFNSLRKAGKATLVFGGTALFTKELFERVGGFDPSLRTAEDLELFDRMADHGPIVTIAEPLLHYRLHPGSTVGKTFFEGRQIHRFVQARRQARIKGTASMNLEEFKDWERGRPFWARIGIRLGDSAQYHYRKAGMAYGQGDKAGFVWNLVRAFVANPIWVVRRLWHQRLSRTARSEGGFQ
jgi:glycosyltransferase involved in cell wall biosynthesis